MIDKLHFISHEREGKSHEAMIEEACEAGVKWIQLRIKDKSEEQVLLIAQRVRLICSRFKAVFILNDHVLIAKQVNADGVHLGASDMDPLVARTLLSKNSIIGGTANTIEDIRRLKGVGVDYIGLGPFRFTETKEKLSPILGIEGYKEIVKHCMEERIELPIIAIGGVVLGDVESLQLAGVYGVAMSAAIAKHEMKEKIIESVYSILNNSNVQV